MPYEKFDIAKLERLNDEARFAYLPPDVLWAAAGVSAPAAIADVGAGTGLFAARFAEMAPEAAIYAVDSEPTMIHWMLANRQTGVCARVRAIQSHETVIPLATGETDLAFMINVHHELADPRASYREVLRLLRIGGTLVVADWRPGGEVGGPPQDVRASADAIAALLETVGFSDIVSHDELERHSLLTARKPEVCSL